jgi:DNA-binding Xre family transcriptional regulator
MNKSKLQTILNRKGMSQTELMLMTKKYCETPVPIYTINKICRGKLSNYSVNTLMKLCKVLEIAPTEILSESDYTHIFKSN